MQFAKHIREKVIDVSVTCSVRIWQSARVKAGGRYRAGPGFIEVLSVREVSLGDITPALTQKSGFAGVVDLLKTAKHGAGEKVYLVGSRYADS